MRLNNGEHFPTITASRVGGGEMSIPQDLAGRWAVLLFYRGHWCPYCRQQLLDFQRAKAQLNELGAEVVALSVDSLEQAQQTVERHKLSFPVLYGLDARTALGKMIGASMNEDPPYLQATGFVLRPNGTVAVAVYSSSAIGRLVAADTINYLKYLQKTQSLT
jgi:peroxiredoxin